MSSHPPVGSLYAPQSSPHMVGAYTRQSSSPARSPQRLRVHNPDPPSDGGENYNSDHNSDSNGYASSGYGYGGQNGNGQAGNYYGGRSAPPAQPAFAPSNASPLRPRNQNNDGGRRFGNFAFGNNNNGRHRDYRQHSRFNSVPPEDSQHAHLLPKPSPRRLRHSKSSEGLRKLGKNDQNNNYHSLSDEDDDPEERLRLPSEHRPSPRSVSGSATTFPTMQPEYQQPPQQPAQMAFPQASLQSSSDSDPFTNGAPPARLPPYPAAASPNKAPRPLSDVTLTRHSRNSVLLSAETGGMLANNQGSYIKGKGPGELIVTGGPRPRGPAGPKPLGTPKSPASTLSPLRLPDMPAVTQPQPPPQPRPQSQPPLQAPALQMPSPATTQPVNYPPIPLGPRRQSSSPPQDTSSTMAPSSNPASVGHEFPQQPLSPQAESAPTRPRRQRRHSDGEALATLARQGTLFHPASSQERAARELDVMLGKPRSRRLSANRLLPAPETPTKAKELVRLEAAKKSRARVELDVVIERECVVEGGDIRGRLEVIVRGGKRGKGLRVGGGKLRVLGFEETDNGQTRHIFYQHQYRLREFVDQGAGDRCSLFTDLPDEEGFRAAKEGTHDLSFSMPLPVNGGAKGCYTATDKKGPSIRYVVVGSIKLHIPSTGKRAIAHFYRPIVILPYLDPSTTLAPSPQPVVAHTTSGLGWRIGGEKGKVEVQVALGRRNWVAGQRVWCQVAVRNQSHKKINRCTLAILQTVNTFGIPKGNQKKPPVETVRSKIAEEVVEADFMEIGSGHITSKSWWTGLEPGESNRWDLSVPIPTGMLSITRSRFVEVSYTLRVTLNNTIYVDVPVRLINFLSIDPPPMPGDARRRMPVKTQVPVVLKPVASSSVASSPVPQITGPGYTVEQLQGEEAKGDVSQAKVSSTTLHIDNLVAEGRARAASQGMLGDDLHPRPPSPGSVYSSMNGRSEAGYSVDEEERNHYAVEAARRDGREQSLALINSRERDLHSETLLTDDEDEHLTPEEKRTYLPDEPPKERVLSMGDDYDPAMDSSAALETASDADISSAASETDTDRTPVASPRLCPVEFAPVAPLPMFDIPDFGKHPRDEYLAHISEEEEPIDDDMLTEIVGADGRGHFQGDNMDDMDDDDFDEDAAHGELTPRGARQLASPKGATPTEASLAFTKEREMLLQERRSLQDRLAFLCGKPGPESQQSPVESEETEEAEPQGPPAVYAVLPSRPKTVDFTEPLDIDTMSLNSLSIDDDQSTFGGHGSPYQRPQTVMSYSHPSWSEDPPSLPAPGGARDIAWGGALTGRTVSGRSAFFSFSDDSHSLSHRSSASTLRGRGMVHDHESKDLYGMSRGMVRTHESFNIASELISDSEDELEPPNLRRRGSAYASSSDHGSFVTAHGSYVHSADGEHEMPPLATPENSDSDSAELPESPTKQPLYTRPLPPQPAGKPKRHSLEIPDRFKPQTQNRVVSDAESHDSFISSTSTDMTATTQGSVLPAAVRARVAQIEMRSEALRKFSVASSAGLVQSPPQLLAPLPSGGSNGRVSPNGRKSYTAALSSRSRSPASMHSPGSVHSNTMSERSEVPDSPFSAAFSFDSSPSVLNRSPPIEQLAEVPEMPHQGLDAQALGGSAFARGMTSPTSSIGHSGQSRWSGSDLSHGGNTLLSRANSIVKDGSLTSRTLVSPRGPRARQAAISHAPLGNPHKTLPFPPTMSAASTPTKLPPLFISVKSESASLEDGYSSDTYSDSAGHTFVEHPLVKMKSNSSQHYSDTAPSPVSSRSDWSTGWTGASVRLPRLQHP